MRQAGGTNGGTVRRSGPGNGRAAILAAALLIALVPAHGTRAQTPTWKLLRPTNSGIPGEEVRLLSFDADGTLWVGARWPFFQEGGFGLYDRKTDLWGDLSTFETPIPSEYVNDIAFAADGTVWIATDGGLVKKQGSTWTVYTTANAPLLHNYVRQVALDSQGNVWINNTDVTNQSAALFRFDGTNWTKFAVPTEIPWTDPWRQLEGLVVDAQDHVWVGNMTLTGVAEYNGTGWMIRGGSISTLVPRCVDDQNGVWMTTGGLAYEAYRWNGSSFSLFGGSTPPNTGTTFTSIAMGLDNSIYLGNWTGAVARTTDRGSSWTSFATVTSFVTGIAFEPLGSGEVWVGSQGAVHRFSSTGSLMDVYNTYNTGIPDFWIDRFNLDPDGHIWVATGEGGLSRFDGVRWRNWGNHNAGSEPYPFAGNEPMGCYFQDASGTGWMGGNGIARWDPGTGQFSGFWNWQNNTSMGVGMWEYIAQDVNGTLFAVEEYGNTYWFDGSQWVRDTTVQPYAPLGVPAVEVDHQGNIWIAGWFALHEWDGTSWTTVGDTWPLFDMGGVNSMALGPDDTIWIGTPQGLLHWDGTTITTFTTANSPLPADGVVSVAFRPDGLMAVATVEQLSWTNSAVILIDGDPSNAANWDVYPVIDTPIPHWQMNTIRFDANGDLWISALSEGVAIMTPPVATSVVDVAQGETRFSFDPPAPNPFRTRTVLRFEVPAASEHARLAVYDVQGRLVRTLLNGPGTAGSHSVTWDGRDEGGQLTASGVYFVRLEAGGMRTAVPVARLRD